APARMRGQRRGWRAAPAPQPPHGAAGNRLRTPRPPGDPPARPRATVSRAASPTDRTLPPEERPDLSVALALGAEARSSCSWRPRRRPGPSDLPDEPLGIPAAPRRAARAVAPPAPAPAVRACGP